MSDIVKVAIIGFGGIARMHYAAYRAMIADGSAVKVVAVVDKNAAQFKSNMRINLGSVDATLDKSVHTYTDIDELIRAEEFDVADICLPSFLHKDAAVKLMQAGKHVISEKPMALNYADCCEMLEASRTAGVRLMIGQCLRFESAYVFLKACCDDGRFGHLRYMSMARLSEYPTWSSDGWFNDKKKCGGCIIDTHVHDVDFVRFLFGDPDRVSCVTFDNIPKCQLVNTRLFYGNVAVVIDAAWDDSLPKKFEAKYAAKFDKASVYFDGNIVMVYPSEGKPYLATITEDDSVKAEIAYFLNLVKDGDAENTYNTPESAAGTIRLTELLLESAEAGGKEIKIEK